MTKIIRSWWQRTRQGQILKIIHSLMWSEWGNCNCGRVRQGCGRGYQGKSNLWKKNECTSANINMAGVPSSSPLHGYPTIFDSVIPCTLSKLTGCCLHAQFTQFPLDSTTQQWSLIFFQQVTRLFSGILKFLFTIMKEKHIDTRFLAEGHAMN